MPRRNRVDPFSRIHAVDSRGLFTGNRGILHRDGALVTERWRSKLWIVCDLNFRGNRRELMSPGTWTELFFLDEATAFAAGHRPCALCRREAYDRFRAAWQSAFGTLPKAAEIDTILHAERVPMINGARPEVQVSTLPFGSMVEVDGQPCLISADGPRKWSFGGYQPCSVPNQARLITPPTLVEVIRHGYSPVMHPSA